MGLVLLIILILLLCGGVPAYRAGTLEPYSPLGIILLVIVILILFSFFFPYPLHRWGYW